MAFPHVAVGLLGGGSRDKTPILIATYHSAAIYSETLGHQYALLIFDEFFLHQQIIFDSFLSQQAKSAFGDWVDLRKL
jgi:superfamily II DNA or RNA helicase